MKCMVILIDDNADYPFWGAGDWTPPEDWELVAITPEEDREQETPLWEWFFDALCARIGDCAPGDQVYVVTDGHFGPDAGGGARLLTKVAASPECEEHFVRGVVYSTDPRLESVDERLAAVEVGEGTTAAEVWRFLRDGEAPASAARKRDEALSSAVHDIKALAFPLELDLGTLRDDPSQVDSISGDYFSDVSTEQETRPRYLSASMPFEGRAGRVLGLENRVLEILESVVGRRIGESSEGYTQLKDALRTVREGGVPTTPELLTEALAPILEALTAIAAGLREGDSSFRAPAEGVAP